MLDHSGETTFFLFCEPFFYRLNATSSSGSRISHEGGFGKSQNRERVRRVLYFVLCSVASQEKHFMKIKYFKSSRHLKHILGGKNNWQWSAFLVNGSVFGIDHPASRFKKQQHNTCRYLPTGGDLMVPSWAGHLDVASPLNFTSHQENEKYLGADRKAAGSLTCSGALICQRVPTPCRRNNFARWLGSPAVDEMPLTWSLLIALN